MFSVVHFVWMQPNYTAPSPRLNFYFRVRAADTGAKGEKKGDLNTYKASLIITSEGAEIKVLFLLCVNVMCRHHSNVCMRNAYFSNWNKGLTQQNGEKLLIFMNSCLWQYLLLLSTHACTHQVLSPSFIHTFISTERLDNSPNEYDRVTWYSSLFVFFML